MNSKQSVPPLLSCKRIHRTATVEGCLHQRDERSRRLRKHAGRSGEQHNGKERMTTARLLTGFCGRSANRSIGGKTPSRIHHCRFSIGSHHGGSAQPSAFLTLDHVAGSLRERRLASLRITVPLIIVFAFFLVFLLFLLVVFLFIFFRNLSDQEGGVHAILHQSQIRSVHTRMVRLSRGPEGLLNHPRA